jgi:hypothetical protein
MIYYFLNLVISFDELVLICLSVLRYIVFIEDLGLFFGYKIGVDRLLTEIEINMNEAIGYLWVKYQ